MKGGKKDRTEGFDKNGRRRSRSKMERKFGRDEKRYREIERKKDRGRERERERERGREERREQENKSRAGLPW